MPAVETNRALSFGKVAGEYARWRPGYPDGAVAWLSPRRPARVADVGAGTGKLTSLLLAQGLQVEAVEPDPAMLAVLVRDNLGARPHLSVAHLLPFENASLHAVLAADAWHWFDVDATVAEVRRVLRPGGWLGLVWNLVTPMEAWEFEVAGIDPDRKGTTPIQEPLAAFPAGEVESARFPWTWAITPEHYTANLATNSAVIAMEAQERAELLKTAGTALQRACDSMSTPSLPLHLEAACFRWTPSGGQNGSGGGFAREGAAPNSSSQLGRQQRLLEAPDTSRPVRTGRPRGREGLGSPVRR
jgi:SAM-dependent methyltransferase